METENYPLLPKRIITPFEMLENTQIDFDTAGNFLLHKAAKSAKELSVGGAAIKAGTAIPGLMDIHVHGGFGVAFGIGQLRDDLEKYSAWAAGNGVIGFLLSITGPDTIFISKTISAYVKILEATTEWPGAIPLGLHLEGPFLNPEKHGAFNPTWICNPNLNEIKKYIEIGNGWIKHVSMAPELEHADIVASFLVDSGVIVSLGHSNTDYETARTALDGHFTHVTHTFNAQSSLHHRAPGVIGAVLSSDSATAELIGDAFHVHPAAMKILFRCLGRERMILITDAMPGAGLPDGEYELLDQKVTVKADKATLPDGTICGSTATMDSALRTMVNMVDVPLEDAVRIAAFNPAKLIGLESRMGSIENGKDGSLVLLDEYLEVQKTFIKGKLVYSKQNEEQHGR